MKNRTVFTIIPAIMIMGALVGCKNDVTYTVTFDTDGGTTIESVKVKKGEKVGRPANNPVKDGELSFIDWYTTKTGDNKFDFENTTITANITIYAHYGVKELILERADYNPSYDGWHRMMPGKKYIVKANATNDRKVGYFNVLYGGRVKPTDYADGGVNGIVAKHDNIEFINISEDGDLLKLGDTPYSGAITIEFKTKSSLIDDTYGFSMTEDL